MRLEDLLGIKTSNAPMEKTEKDRADSEMICERLARLATREYDRTSWLHRGLIVTFRNDVGVARNVIGEPFVVLEFMPDGEYYGIGNEKMTRLNARIATFDADMDIETSYVESWNLEPWVPEMRVNKLAVEAALREKNADTEHSSDH